MAMDEKLNPNYATSRIVRRRLNELGLVVRIISKNDKNTFHI